MPDSLNCGSHSPSVSYCAGFFSFIVCSSFTALSFLSRFSDDPEFVRSQFVRFFAPPYDHGVRRFSLPDVVSNVLLVVPFGLLWVVGEFSLHLQSRFWRVAFTAGLLAGLVIESGQMFSPGSWTLYVM